MFSSSLPWRYSAEKDGFKTTDTILELRIAVGVADVADVAAAVGAVEVQRDLVIAFTAVDGGGDEGGAGGGNHDQVVSAKAPDGDLLEATVRMAVEGEGALIGIDVDGDFVVVFVAVDFVETG